MKFKQDLNFIQINYNFLLLIQDELAVLLNYFNVLNFKIYYVLHCFRAHLDS